MCPRCGWPNLLLCADCGYQASVTAGTIFQDTRKPLTLWFRAAWWVTRHLELQRVLGLSGLSSAAPWCAPVFGLPVGGVASTKGPATPTSSSLVHTDGWEGDFGEQRTPRNNRRVSCCRACSAGCWGPTRGQSTEQKHFTFSFNRLPCDQILGLSHECNVRQGKVHIAWRLVRYLMKISRERELLPERRSFSLTAHERARRRFILRCLPTHHRSAPAARFCSFCRGAMAAAERLRMTISTRRLAARPCGELLSATGRSSP